jgi:hypothetical protein
MNTKLLSEELNVMNVKVKLFLQQAEYAHIDLRRRVFYIW